MFLIYAGDVEVKVFLRNFGCSSNLADGEVLAGCLASAGFTLVNSENDAEVVIYNSCAVKGPTENRIIDALKRVPKERKLVVTGCLPLISFERLLQEVHFDGVAGPAIGKGIVEVVTRVAKGEKVVALENALTTQPPLDLPRIQTNPVVSVIPVNYGCLGSCAYCCVIHARGRLRSYPIKDIAERVKTDLALGSKEFWITSQDTACYGRDIGTNLAELLNTLSHLEGDFRIRVGMMTPNIVAPILPQVIEAFGSKKVYKFVHLPVQSGDDAVLKKMRRFYTAKEFKDIVAQFKKAFPQITLSTDVICGFPSENTDAFEKTLKLLEEVKPDVVNVSKFFARPKTAALKMKEEFVERSEIKRRSVTVTQLAKKIALEKNQQWLGWKGEILVNEKGKVPASWIGRNFAYKPITVVSEKELLGKTVQVKIVKALSTHLSAIII
ncbi:MAG: tRNA (N(6)-L-threonylcarbamoyladenosine(37)-C(2))-methylthiotransferase [Candidatus Bathyarchaeota archaeon]|nr:tRNA (N(6)-L-threonylcarbamoyladenosine(37)-C(2))-methylthiotransferase [Candidatus Bathyarchaeota archaeon]